MTARTEFLGLPFDTLTAPAVAAWLAARGTASAYGYVVTPNVDHMVRLEHAPADVRAAYHAADLMLCDSRVLARLAALNGVALSIVPGSDLVAALFAHVLQPGDRLCLIGGSADDARILRARYPALAIVHHVPPMGLRHDPAARAAAARFAVAAGARVILLAVGSPQQELLAHEIGASPGARGTALCIGASVAFLTGAQRRAPRLVQRLTLEWAWRLATDPRRLARRYLVEGPAIFPMVWRWRRGRRR